MHEGSGRSHPGTTLVTGAAGGLGRSVAVGLAARGCSVAMVDIDGKALAEAAEACRESGVQVIEIITDLTTDDGASGAIRQSVEAFGHLDILVNNAGYGTVEAFTDMTAAAWDRTLALNVKALALGCAAAGQHMKERGSGRIINVTSPASRMALPNYTAYAASKAAVDAITRAGAIALAPFGVRVNSLAPGMMDTPMQRVTEAQLAALNGREDVDAFLAERTARVPIGRRVECDEVAKGVIWLALDAPSYITAERLNFSGGLDRD
ncbi:SDR family NAD(P)-dependent oxidoreductase [Microvirga puerhi]|uniref:SDR family oxidoreductase n=1 Tax=Microvirga puerhi TaxID=2876078 RepID=A0ABS7VVL9_9HYPH|nr:SDR family oxidoreductase [Microvirga puerhi]MBZ6079095.1 SDR family oxidoreductase [Microvirga puerhi]